MLWIDLVRRNVQAAEVLSNNGVRGTRRALLAIWLAIEGADDNVRDLFRGFDEDRLEADVDAISLADAFAQIAPTAAKSTAAKEALLRSLAVCLRVLERQLWSLGGSAVQRREKPAVVEFDGTSAYLLMRAPRHRVAKTEDNFRRRGLKKTRLIPRKIGKLDVRLVFLQDFRGHARLQEQTPLTIAAALFPGIRYVEKTVPEGFVVVDVEVEDQIEVMRRQIRDASLARCAGIVYPELSVTSQTLSAVRAGLSDGVWEECELSMIVAGSRHEADGAGRRFNVCTILDGYGNAIGEHRKLFRYSEGTGPHEAIDLGSELQVLVMAEGLFAFGICLDFCNLSERPPYLDLDVDYVIVPSCGKESTMYSHMARSGEVMTRLKVRTFVVQQYYRKTPEEPGPVGYVLARVDAVMPELSSLATSDPWHVHVV
ncbi:hypothetical protein [Bradyrhizobium acaciae]|uniref:hypothetical protein n=1 Tax=Bradyrhizobium acaciae TaxID=2683706 RepID=UPI001E294989|nr:hypothetical protein [Bradyrhizobium acaciae]MCC8978549.1 hypothetical protein [Bradyrhizobium acaciae]